MSAIPRVWYVIGAIVAAMLVLAGIGAITGNSTGEVDDDGSGDGLEVIYTVTDSRNAGVSITYQNDGGNTEQVQNVPTTWTKRLIMNRGDFVYVSAQRGVGTGTVECTIRADGKRIEQAESSGEFVIATCSGSVP